MVKPIEPPNRLRELRNQRGMTLERLAEGANTTFQQIQRLERGHLRLSHGWMVQLARALDCDPAELMSDSYSRRWANVRGKVGAGDQVVWVDTEPYDRIEAPPQIDDASAVIVDGDSMWPVYRHGETIFYGRPRRPDECLRRDCIIQTTDGSVFIKKLLTGSRDDVFTLRSYRSPEDIKDVEIEWCALVEWVRRE